MKALMRKICSPLLNLFEGGEGQGYTYRQSHRRILAIVGALFLILASGSLAMALHAGLMGGLVPALFFGGAGVVCLIVAWLGSDEAVARIWKNR